MVATLVTLARTRTERMNVSLVHGWLRVLRGKQLIELMGTMFAKPAVFPSTVPSMHCDATSCWLVAAVTDSKSNYAMILAPFLFLSPNCHFLHYRCSSPCLWGIKNQHQSQQRQTKQNQCPIPMPNAMQNDTILSAAAVFQLLNAGSIVSPALKITFHLEHEPIQGQQERADPRNQRNRQHKHESDLRIAIPVQGIERKREI